MTTLSAVLACYKDDKSIPILYERLTKVFKSLEVDYEIVFVSDGCPSGSTEVIRELSEHDNHVVGVVHSRNFGSQAALMSGTEIATGDAIIWMDADGQDVPELIPQLYSKWKEGNQVVYVQNQDREGPFLLRHCAKLFYKIFSKMSSVPMPLNAGNFSLIDRVVADELLKFPERDLFLRGLRAYVGFKQAAVTQPKRPERLFGKSTNNLHNNIKWAKKGIFGFSQVPLEMMTYAGVFFTFIAFLGIIWQIVYHFMNPTVAPGFSTLIVLILFFGGLNLLAISIVGEYIGVIFSETKQRPTFIRHTVLRNGEESNE